MDSMMTPRQIMLVQATFEQSRARSRIIGERFYRRLFSRYPELRALFTGDMQDQAGKLIRIVAVLVDSLDRPNETADILFELGIRHQVYGVRIEHYRAAGRIFLWAIKPSDGNPFSTEIKQAWMAFYEMIVEQMVEAPRQALQAQA
ncbi:MAG: globin domain-containing protein [Acidiferrobacterales bacterium]|jgi:hemoglobin-like flavoprotein|nr:globin domain-containing protein [Acidiferrobacterales bacterium]